MRKILILAIFTILACFLAATWPVREEKPIRLTPEQQRESVGPIKNRKGKG